MKDKSNIKYIFGIIISIIVSSVISVTAAGTLFDSSEVVYDNSNSGLNASTVKGAIDELYAAANNYAAYDTRLTAVENRRTCESGTSGAWTYTKCSDGSFDMWIRGSAATPHAATFAPFYQYNLTNISFPADLKPSSVNYTVSGYVRVGNSYGILAGINNESVNAFNAIVLTAASGSQTVYYRFHVHGYWS